jgi:hypothetical protein
MWWQGKRSLVGTGHLHILLPEVEGLEEAAVHVVAGQEVPGAHRAARRAVYHRHVTPHVQARQRYPTRLWHLWIDEII